MKIYLALLIFPLAYFACNKGDDSLAKGAKGSDVSLRAMSLKGFCSQTPDRFYENCENYVKQSVFEEKYGVPAEFKAMNALVKHVGTFTFPSNANSQEAADACSALETRVTSKRATIRVRDLGLQETDDVTPLCHFYQKVSMTWFDGSTTTRVSGASGSPNESVTGSTANTSDSSTRADTRDSSGGDATNVTYERLDGAPDVDNPRRCVIGNRTGHAVTLVSLSYGYRCDNGVEGSKTDKNSSSIFHNSYKSIEIQAPSGCSRAVATWCSAEYIKE